MTTATAKVVPANYSDAQVQIIRDYFVAAGRPLNFDDCIALAARDDMLDNDGQPRKPRSIAAKINRLDDVDYKAKEPVSKTGKPVAKKADIVTAIAAHVTGNLDGLDKAPKPALEAIRDTLAAMAA